MVMLTCLLGIPGSGKSTYAERHAGRQTVLTTHPIRQGRSGWRSYYAALERQAEKLLREGVDVLVDACNTQPHRRREWLGIAEAAGADTRLIVVHVELASALDRQGPRRHRVAANVVRDYFTAYMQALDDIQREPWGSVHHIGKPPAGRPTPGPEAAPRTSRAW